MDTSIAIVTVVFNNAETIHDTIKSVQSQQGVQAKHLIIDGASTDGTLDIVRKLSYAYLQVVSEPDQGIYDAMNKGIRLATCSIIGFLNSDDVYYDHRVLASVQQAFAQNPQIQIVYGDLLYVSKYNLNKIVRVWKTKVYSSRFFENGYTPPHPSFFVKRSALIESGGFDLTFQLAADYELMFRLLKLEGRPSLYLPKFLVKMRLGGKTNQSYYNILKGNQEIIKTWRKHKCKIPFRFWIMRYFNKIRQFDYKFYK